VAWEQSRVAGRLAYQQERYCNAERAFKEAISKAETFGSRDVRLAESAKELGWVYVGAARLDLVEPLWLRALAVQEAAEPRDEAAIANTTYWIAEIYRQTGRYPDAGRLHRQALAIRERIFVDREKSTVAASLNALGLTYLAQDRPREAESLFRRAIGLWSSVYAPPNEAGAKLNLARALSAVGRDSEALPLYQDAIRTWESGQGWYALPAALESYQWVGQAWYVRPGFGVVSVSLPAALESYASALRAVGRDADAVVAMRKADERRIEIEAARTKRIRELPSSLPPNC
jgi:tetratricopeptide (TPR) repeat protein